MEIEEKILSDEDCAKNFIKGTYMENAKILEINIRKRTKKTITAGELVIRLNGEKIKFEIKSDVDVRSYRDKTILIEGRKSTEIDGYTIRKIAGE